MERHLPLTTSMSLVRWQLSETLEEADWVIKANIKKQSLGLDPVLSKGIWTLGYR